MKNGTLEKPVPVVNSFEECAELYPVMESYPEQCNTPDGKHFTNPIQFIDGSQIEGAPVDPEVYQQLLRSYDEGIAELLDLESSKPNTLGNTRMMKVL